jgi:hypothetical protein
LRPYNYEILLVINILYFDENYVCMTL